MKIYLYLTPSSLVTEAASQNSQAGETRTTGHVSGLAFVKVLVMERLLPKG